MDIVAVSIAWFLIGSIISRDWDLPESNFSAMCAVMKWCGPIGALLILFIIGVEHYERRNKQ